MAHESGAQIDEAGAREHTFSRLLETGAAFLKLGSLSFGGPIAHLGYFRTEFVTQRKWLTDDAYADLVALCQFLPGPASSQVVFALGMLRAGLLGALLATVCFVLPSAILMIAFAYGITHIGGIENAGWVHGLKLAAVAVVAQAVIGMGRNLCPDRPRIILCLLAAAVVLLVPGALIQLAVLTSGGVLGWILFRSSPLPSRPTETSDRRSHLAAGAALILFVTLLVALPPLAAAYDWRPLKVFDSFYRAGSLVFGGGHVILPLLRAEVVPPGWISDDQFLAGYGAAQAIPGPLFTFSGYLGAVIFAGPKAWLGGVLGLCAIFLPACLLIGGALPFWHSLRARPWAQAALKGANASVVGILLAALYQPVMTESISNVRDVVAAIAAFALLQFAKAPPLIVVLLMAAAGQWLLSAFS
ncbi:MAG TPA: chromate efflux transporter [Planctomycetota bacterium]|nr:chromate efflux transporter [Planctomycetota bacterium]